MIDVTGTTTAWLNKTLPEITANAGDGAAVPHASGGAHGRA